MKGTPKTAAEWADALENEAVETVVAEGGSIEDIRDEHARLIEELFEKRADANAHTPAIVASFRTDMLEALHRVDEMAKDREKKVGVQHKQKHGDVLVNKANEDDLEVGKFSEASEVIAA